MSQTKPKPAWVDAAVPDQTVGENQGCVAEVLQQRGLSLRTMAYLDTYYSPEDGLYELYEGGLVIHHGWVYDSIMRVPQPTDTGANA